MQSCETCQVQLLEYLYGLLEDADRQALEAHLAACPACQAELAKTRSQQHLFAAAAKMEFPGVAFQPPAPVAPPEAITAAPASVPFAARSNPTVAKKPVKWGRWAVAAAMLLALGGIAAVLGADVESNLKTMRQWETTQAETRQQQRDVNEQMRTTQVDGDKKVAGVYEAVKEREMKLTVQGPASVQPRRAPSEYQISTKNLKDQPVATQVSVQVSDNGVKIGAPINAEAIDGKPGVYHVKLPPDLPLSPNSHPILLVSAKRAIGTKTEVEEQLALVSKVYMTHLTTDKPMYQPGETVYFRSLTLDRATLKPADQDLRLHFTVTTPLGAIQEIAQGGNGLQKEADGKLITINGPDGKPIKGVGTGSYYLDGNLPGGEYVLTLREEQNRFSEQQRKFIVNKYQKPRLNKELDFNRKTYGPGDEVQAAVKVTSNDNIPLGGKPGRSGHHGGRQAVQAPTAKRATSGSP